MPARHLEAAESARKPVHIRQQVLFRHDCAFEFAGDGDASESLPSIFGV